MKTHLTLAILFLFTLAAVVPPVQAQTPPPIYLPVVVQEPQATPEPDSARVFLPAMLAPAALTATPSPTPTLPPSSTDYATSYYVQADSSTFDSTEQNRLYNAGCALGARDLNTPGAQDSIVVMAFGKPWQSGSSYGVKIYSQTVTRPFLTMAQVRDAAKWMIDGYWDCSGSDTASQVTFAIGVNTFDCYGRSGCTEDTSPPPEDYDNDALEHGYFFARMINELHEWVVSQGMHTQVTVAAGLDSELAWNPPFIARNWVAGFINGNRATPSGPQRHRFYNFGACEGCPTASGISYTTLRDWRGLNGWSLDDVYYISWGAIPAWPLPEIYLVNGLNSNQWANVSRWGALQYGEANKIMYPGLLTQWQACQQRNCNDGTDLAPLAARDQFLARLNSDPLTDEQWLRWLSDIKWLIR